MLALQAMASVAEREAKGEVVDEDKEVSKIFVALCFSIIQQGQNRLHEPNCHTSFHWLGKFL